VEISESSIVQVPIRILVLLSASGLVYYVGDQLKPIQTDVALLKQANINLEREILNVRDENRKLEGKLDADFLRILGEVSTASYTKETIQSILKDIKDLEKRVTICEASLPKYKD